MIKVKVSQGLAVVHENTPLQMERLKEAAQTGRKVAVKYRVEGTRRWRVAKFAVINDSDHSNPYGGECYRLTR